MPDKKTSLPVEDLVSLLRQKFHDDCTIENVDWKNLTDPGENYGSLIIAVNVTIRRNAKTEVHNLVVKLPPPSTWLQELFNSPFTFLKELQFYRDITPVFIELQRENGIAEPEKTWLSADYYGGRLGLVDNNKFDNQAAIVLQNLNFMGFTTIDRMVGLTASQTLLAVRKLAKLHAIPIAMRTKKKESFEKLILPSLGQPANETAKNCLMDMIKKSLNDLKAIPQCRSYLPRVDKTMEYIGSMEHTMKNEKKDHWATLLHNDFWVNNMMFKNDEFGNAVDMKMVDFQLYVYDYGVNDLVFFLVSSPMRQVIDNDFDRMIDAYYESFIEILGSMGVDLTDYPKQQFIARLNECATLKFPQCIMMNQVIKSKPGAAPKMEDIDCPEIFLTIGGGEIYQEKMLHTVEFFDKRGWLKK